MATTPFVDDLAVITALIATGGDLDGAKMHLAVSGPAIGDKNAVVADFTEPGYTGHAAVAITWGTPYYGPDGQARVDTQLFSFDATVVPSPDTVFGWFITDTAGTLLKIWDAFQTAIVISKVGQAVSFAVSITRADAETVQIL